MIPTTINQKTAVLLQEGLIFEHQLYITWNFKAKPSPEERDMKVSSHLIFTSRQNNAHLFPIVGVNLSGDKEKQMPYHERNPHAHAILLSDKRIDIELLSQTWLHGNLDVRVFNPKHYLTKHAGDAYSYIIENHDFDEKRTIICPKHNKRACVPECKWLRRTLVRESVSPEDASLLRMALNLW